MSIVTVLVWNTRYLATMCKLTVLHLKYTISYNNVHINCIRLE